MIAALVGGFLVLACPAAHADEAVDLTRPGAADGPTPIIYAGYVIDLREIDQAHQRFEVDFALALKWMDPRLAEPGTPLRRIDLADIWHPQIQIVNAVDFDARMPEEALVSETGEVRMLQRYAGTLTARLELLEFPLDDQHLSIHFVCTGLRPGDVAFGRGKNNEFKSGCADPVSIPDWDVTGWSFAPFPYESAGFKPIAGLDFRIEVDRISGTYFISIVGVVVVIIMMSWMVFWLDVSLIPGRLSTAVTSMLTLIAYRFVAASQLPNVAYMTRLDWFLTLSFGLVLMGLIHVVYTTHLVTAGELERGNRINRIGRVVAPVLFVAVTLLSFLA